MITWPRCPSERSRSGVAASIVIVILALVGAGGRAAGREPADAPLPEITPAQLAAKLREAMGRYEDRGLLRVVFTDTRDMSNRYAAGRGKPEDPKPVLVSYRGRARHESDGTRWRVVYESVIPSLGSTRLTPDRWATGFDGTRRYEWKIRQNQFLLGASSPAARRWTPRSVIWEMGEPLVSMLEEKDRARSSIEIEQRTIDGVRCYVVASKTPDGKWGSETIVSPSQGYLPIRRKWTYRGRTYSSRSLSGVHEVGPGIWAPERIEEETNEIRDEGTARFESRRRMQIVEYRPRQVPTEATLPVEIPYGVDVVDRPAGYSYQNDPWWAEVGAMLHEKFAWPPPDFSPLQFLGSDSERKLDGQPAPPLRIANWLNAKPTDLAALRGKVVLVEFGDIRDSWEPQFAPALRSLYAAYHPLGLEILSIQPPEADAEEVRRFARDNRLPYPMVIDEREPGSSGATARAFGIQGRVVAFLIDHEGRIRPAGDSTNNGGRVVEMIVTLLKKAGVRDVEPVSLETPRLPDDAFKAAEALYRTRFKEALDAGPSGRIAGRIVDGDRNPIPDASVQVTPRFTMLMMTSPGANYLVDYRGRDERFAGRSDADGRFVLSGLCKGAYNLVVRSPGRAWAERKVFLAPDQPSASADFVLDQKDAIAGQVRDPEGRPIANASLTPTWREHFEDGLLRFKTSVGGIAATTGEAGRFRLTGLQQGHYIIEVKAPGFKDREVDAIPVGDENVVVTLERLP